MIDIRNSCAISGIRLIEDKSVDLIVTDPPYRTISGGSGPTSAMHSRPSGMLCKNDGKIFEHNSVEFDEYLPDLFRVLKDDSHMYLMVNFLNLESAMSSVRSAGFGIHNLLIWKKNNATPNRWYMKNIEYVIFARKGKAKAIRNKGSKTCHDFNNIIGKKTHPTEKPISLISHYIENSSNTGDLVLDPFMGSGSSAVASASLGRRFLGFEIDEQYFSIAKERLAAYP